MKLPHHAFYHLFYPIPEPNWDELFTLTNVFFSIFSFADTVYLSSLNRIKGRYLLVYNFTTTTNWYLKNKKKDISSQILLVHIAHIVHTISYLIYIEWYDIWHIIHNVWYEKSYTAMTYFIVLPFSWYHFITVDKPEASKE